MLHSLCEILHAKNLAEPAHKKRFKILAIVTKNKDMP